MSLQDTDFFLVNRGGASYKVTFDDVKDGMNIDVGNGAIIVDGGTGITASGASGQANQDYDTTRVLSLSNIAAETVLGNDTATNAPPSGVKVTGSMIVDSVNLPGSPTANSPADTDNSTKLATTEYVQNNLSSVNADAIKKLSYNMSTGTVLYSKGIDSVARTITTGGFYMLTANFPTDPMSNASYTILTGVSSAYGGSSLNILSQAATNFTAVVYPVIQGTGFPAAPTYCNFFVYQTPYA